MVGGNDFDRPASPAGVRYEASRHPFLVLRQRAVRALLAILMVLTACEQAPKVMRFDPIGELDDNPGLVWPKRPDVPRFAYAGQLVGEVNFQEPEDSKKSTFLRVLSVIIGLDHKNHVPIALQRPQGGIADEQGRIYVTDVSRAAVFVFDELQGRLLVWDMAGPNKRFVAPIGIALGRDGEVLVSDAELGHVVRLDHEGKPIGSFGQGILTRPTGIARDPKQGRIYVADTRANDIKIFDDEGSLLGLLGSEGDSPGSLNSPTYLTLAHDHLYVTDTLNSRIQVFDLEGNLTKVFGERGLYIGNLARPKGIGVDTEGNIYVIESYFDYLLMFDPDGQFLLPIGGTGHQPGQFYLPAGVWTDSRDRVYVADMFNGRVSVFQFLGGTP